MDVVRAVIVMRASLARCGIIAARARAERDAAVCDAHTQVVNICLNNQGNRAERVVHLTCAGLQTKNYFIISRMHTIAEN